VISIFTTGAKKRASGSVQDALKRGRNKKWEIS